MRILPVLLLALGCRSEWTADTGKPDGNPDDTGPVVDSGDCGDADAGTNVGAVELCDGIDNNCDGQVDEGVLATFYADLDADGFGDAEQAREDCEQPAGYVSDDTDCDDADPDAFPGNPEACDGKDNDCDGTADNGVTQTWYADADSDGHGDPDVPVEDCVQPGDAVESADDCDDTDPNAFPENPEVCDTVDNDCDGSVDEDVLTTWWIDLDGDGWGDAASTDTACTLPTGYAATDGDCDDSNADVSPDGMELCNEIDDDCDGTVDEDDALDASVWYADVDADGYGDPDAPTTACELPAGYVDNDEDCDDADASLNPDTIWYYDYDYDGYGDATHTLVTCEPPSGWVLDATDCNDARDDAFPGATEVCNGEDDDCDGSVDEAGSSGESTWYADGDADGWGDPTVTESACDTPSGYVADSTDCDDTTGAVSPAATEVCNEFDDDCDGAIDDDDSAVSGGSSWYFDGDGDGYGDASDANVSCDPSSHHVADATDCDDTDDDVNPGATEVCNGEDDDCDGDVDEDDATDAGTWYADDDGDGYGDADFPSSACDTPSGYVSNADDCDDGDDAVSPAGLEVCDGVDNDCDGDIDDDDSSTLGTPTWYADDDGDGYGDAGDSVEACDAPADYVENDDDCDDTDASVYSSSTEVFDGVDNDCDGTVDDGVYGVDCQEILDVDSSSGSGTYTIDPDGSGGTSAFSVECEMTIDGGAWTQSIQAYLDHLSTSDTRRYLYSEGGAWYMSPVTAYVWSWSSYQYQNGTYSYATSGTSVMGTFSCTHAESGDWGVGCSNGGGGTYKVLPIYYSTPSSAYSMICQDQPDAFSAGACQANASIWSREE